MQAALGLALACGFAAAVVAQQTPPASDNPPAATTATVAASEGTEDEMIVLSPFEVNASRDVGYLAQNTLAGSRLNSELKDTASAISVMYSPPYPSSGASRPRARARS